MTQAVSNIANIEAYGSQGAYFSRREKNPFFHLGTVVQDDVTSREDVLNLAHLANWNVRHVDLNDVVDSDTDVVNNIRLVKRDNPFWEEGSDLPKYNILGTVKSRHEIIQNEEVAEFAEALLVGGRYETAGSLAGGTKIFITMALDTDLIIDENGINDKINSYLVLANAHDGSGALTAAVTNIRIVCTNTLDYALKNAQQKFVIRHTKSAQDKMELAIKTLKLATRYNVEFKEDSNALLHERITDKQFFDIVTTLNPFPEEDASKREIEGYSAKIETLDAIWNSGTVEGAGVKNTKYGVLQTLVEFDQYYRRVLDEERFWQYGTSLDKLATDNRTRLHDLVASYEN